MAKKKSKTNKKSKSKATTKRSSSRSTTVTNTAKEPTKSKQQLEAEQYLQRMVMNAETSLLRSYLSDQLSPSQQRDIDESCGYVGTDSITAEHYKERWERDPIARRVVAIYPEECWKVSPKIYETEDDQEETEFERAWKNLTINTTGQPNESKFKQKEGNPIWNHLKQVDELAGIGFFGVLLLGLDDGLGLEEPAERKEGTKLTFLRAFDETCAEILSYNMDESDPRFGMPEFYQLTFSTPQGSTGGKINTTKKVHWTRIIHVADGVSSDGSLFGTPRQQPVWNRIWDLRKLFGGSGEMYWKGAFPGLSIETHPSLGADVNVNEETLRTNIKNYSEGLKRYMTLQGMAAKSLAPQVVDPSPQIDKQVEAICIVGGYPKRVFVGSEQGELASSQDTDRWNERLEGRQQNYLTPFVIVPFVDRLIYLGVLPEPKEYCVEWPSLQDTSDDDKATVAIKLVHALTKYVGGDVEHIMSPEDFYTRILGMTAEEAKAIMEKAIESFESSEDREFARQLIEMKALRGAKPQMLTDEEKTSLLLQDPEGEESEEIKKVEASINTDKFTDGADNDIEDIEGSTNTNVTSI